MGASGIKLFDDDLADDIRYQFRELLSLGKTGQEATKILMEQFDDIPGSDEESVLWLALAVVQWQYGMLQHEMLDRALRVIDDGSDLARWAHSENLQRGRRKELEKLRSILQSSNTKPKKLPRRKKPGSRCHWDIGDVLSYELESGYLILLRVVDINRSFGGDSVNCELLDWVGKAVPGIDVIKSLRIRRNLRYRSESKCFFPLKDKYLSRVQPLGIRLPIVLRDLNDGWAGLDFDDLESSLQSIFGMSVEKFTPQPVSKWFKE